MESIFPVTVLSDVSKYWRYRDIYKKFLIEEKNPVTFATGFILLNVVDNVNY